MSVYPDVIIKLQDTWLMKNEKGPFGNRHPSRKYSIKHIF